MICWGRNGSGNNPCIFPMTFINSCYAVFVQSNYGGDIIRALNNIYGTTGNRSVTGFAHAWSVANTFNYLAVGD